MTSITDVLLTPTSPTGAATPTGLVATDHEGTQGSFSALLEGQSGDDFSALDTPPDENLPAPGKLFPGEGKNLPGPGEVSVEFVSPTKGEGTQTDLPAGDDAASISGSTLGDNVAQLSPEPSASINIWQLNTRVKLDAIEQGKAIATPGTQGAETLGSYPDPLLSEPDPELVLLAEPEPVAGAQLMVEQETIATPALALTLPTSSVPVPPSPAAVAGTPILEAVSATSEVLNDPLDSQLLSGDKTKDSTAELLVDTKLSKSSMPDSALSDQSVLHSRFSLSETRAEGNVLSKPSGNYAMTLSPGDRGWGGELANRVHLAVNSGSNEASIELNPPELGRLEIKISMEGDQAKVLFHVNNAAARDALEQAMPRLREMLGQDGLALSHSEVSEQSARREQNEERASSNGSDLAAGVDEESSDEYFPGNLPARSLALVDYYI